MNLFFLVGMLIQASILLAYFIDAQTDGDVDLPHLNLSEWLKKKLRKKKQC